MAHLYKPGRPSKQPPPEKPGEYRWINKETGEVDYYGETNNLKRRQYQHERSDKPVSSDTHDFAWKQADARFSVDARREHERQKIEQHQPKLNQRAGGAGRKSK